MTKANLTHADLYYATLSQTDLTNAWLDNANLTGARLYSTNLSSTFGWSGVIYTGAKYFLNAVDKSGRE